MKLDDLLALVDPPWRTAFLRLIETGEADEAFLSYVDQSPECQKAVELAFSAQAAAFANLARALEPEQGAAAGKEPHFALSAKMATAFEEAIDLPPAERSAVVEHAAAALGAAIEPNRRTELKSVVEDLERQIAKKVPVRAEAQP